VKLYRPLSPDKRKKWGGNSNAHDVGGINQVSSKGVLVFVTSSLKDVMTLRSLGFPAVCFLSEHVPNETIAAPVISSLKRKYRYVVAFMDGDAPGQEANYKISTKYRIPHIYTRKEKDISDFRRKYGEHVTYRMLKKLLRNTFKHTINVPY
jgi:hypothetical protein